MPPSDAHGGALSHSPLSLNLAISVLRHPGEVALRGEAARKSTATSWSVREKKGTIEGHLGATNVETRGWNGVEEGCGGTAVMGCNGLGTSCEKDRCSVHQTDYTGDEGSDVIERVSGKITRGSVLVTTIVAGSWIVLREDSIVCRMDGQHSDRNTVVLHEMSDQYTVPATDLDNRVTPHIKQDQNMAHCTTLPRRYQAGTHNEAQTLVKSPCLMRPRNPPPTSNHSHARADVKGLIRSQVIANRLTPRQPEMGYRGSVRSPGTTCPSQSTPPSTTQQLHEGPGGVSSARTSVASTPSAGNVSQDPSDRAATRELKSLSPFLPGLADLPHLPQPADLPPLPCSADQPGLSWCGGGRRGNGCGLREAALILLMLLLASPVTGEYLALYPMFQF